ncbi:MAG: 3-oxoacyl-ACP synthase III [Bacteriovoracaceae bacterium]|nr:3-oxoacyl-ACP synthase III [Bacteriovoracaceae bacterium]
MNFTYTNVALVDWNFLPPSDWMTTEFIESQLRELYEKLHLSEGRLELMTGIKQRGIYPKVTLPSDLATKATSPIMDRLNQNSISLDQIDLLIYAGVSRDCLEPSTASRVHFLSGLSFHCRNFDLSNACLGFMSATELAAQLIESGQIRYALICSGENSLPLLDHTLKGLKNIDQISRQDLKKSFASLTIGSGAAAWLLGPSQMHTNKPKLEFSHSQAHTRATYLCQGDGNRDGMWMETDAEELLKQGLELAQSHWRNLSQAKEKAMSFDWTKNYQHLFMHQVGRAHEMASTQLLELDAKKMWSIFETYGNMGSVALPATFMLAAENNRFQKNDKILMLGIGSGLNSMICGLSW